eukprot:5607028-Alexandrium_andersonii.AAC.1
MSASLVGSEMCIRDRAPVLAHGCAQLVDVDPTPRVRLDAPSLLGEEVEICLLYTSDAADDMRV